jgi:hypothetical protein
LATAGSILRRVGSCVVGSGGLPRVRSCVVGSVPRVSGCGEEVPPEECIQPGPCCEPESIGRCTPRNYTRLPGGGWAGVPPASINARAVCFGTVTLTKQKRSFFDPVTVPRSWTIPLDFFDTDPRGEYLLEGSGTGDCRTYTGEGDFYIPPSENPPLTNVPRCGGPILPVLVYEKFVRTSSVYSPRGDVNIAGFPPSPNGVGLATHRVIVRAWDFEAEIYIYATRTRGRGTAQPAVVTALAEISVTASTGQNFKLPFSPVVATTQNPCGTTVEVRLVKGPIQAPFVSQGPGFCPERVTAPGGAPIGPDYCEVCTGVDFDFTVRVELADLFTACVKCEEVTVSPCCPAGLPPGVSGYLPSASVPAGGNSSQTRWSGMRLSGTHRLVNTFTPPPNAPNSYIVRSETVTDLDAMAVFLDGSCPVWSCGDNFGLRVARSTTLLSGQVIEETGTACFEGRFDVMTGPGGGLAQTLLLSLFPPGSSNRNGFRIRFASDASLSVFQQVPQGFVVPPGYTAQVDRLGRSCTARFSGAVSEFGDTEEESLVVTVRGLNKCLPPGPPGPPGGGDQLRAPGMASMTVPDPCCGREGVEGVRDVGV